MDESEIAERKAGYRALSKTGETAEEKRPETAGRQATKMDGEGKKGSLRAEFVTKCFDTCVQAFSKAPLH
jgi:hypothetical protein